VTDIDQRLEQALPAIRGGADAADADATFPIASLQTGTSAGLLGLALPRDTGGP